MSEISFPDGIDICQVQETAVRVARKAGQIQLKHFRSSLSVREAQQHDLKLEVDQLCDQAIIHTIQEHFLNHAILTEETGMKPSKGPFLWIVDPLDGSVNYFHNMSYFCASISCYFLPDLGELARFSSDLKAPGEPLVGVVFAVSMGEMFMGVRGQGATLNRGSISCLSMNSLREAMVGFSFGSNPDVQKYNIRLLRILGSKVRKIRSFGSTGLDIAQITAGRLDAMVQRDVRCWDFAAARIVLEEAGGIFNCIQVSENSWNILACRPGIHDVLMEIARPW